jgi:UDP-3-O-[3-hydroxymyristoyl] glucosamine N-acyltransferase
MSFSLLYLADHVGGQLLGDPELLITGLGTLEDATQDELSFIANKRYLSFLQSTQAGAVLVSDEAQAALVSNAILVKNTYLAFAKISQLFQVVPKVWEGVHPSAVIGKNVSLSDDVVICPNAVIEDNVVLNQSVYIGANSVIGAYSSIGAGTKIQANVSIYNNTCIGASCMIHSGVVIGADGFGFAPSSDGWVKIAQLGYVAIGDRVEIGANTTIDRGAIENTRIGNGVIIDNQVQIAHNVVIGDNTAIAGCTAIAGSTKIGERCTIAGAVGIIGHLAITDNVHVTAMSLVTKSIGESGSYSSGTGLETTDKWRRSMARLRRIDDMAKKISKLEQQLNKLT